MKRKIVAYWRNNGRKRSFKSVKANFKRIKNEPQLYRWEKQLEHGTIFYNLPFLSMSICNNVISIGGSRYDKLKVINDHVRDKFVTVRSNFGIVHDIDLKNWAIEKCQEVISHIFVEEYLVFTSSVFLSRKQRTINVFIFVNLIGTFRSILCWKLLVAFI